MADLKRRYPAPTYRPVLITEVTRMGGGYFCVAGWDVHGERMVRPLQSSGGNWRLIEDRYPFQVGELIHCIASSRAHGILPHSTEDLVLARQPSRLKVLREPEAHRTLSETLDASIRKIFGNALIEDKYVIEGTGVRSLGAILIPRRNLVFVESFGKLRAQFIDLDGISYELKVTSERFMRYFAPGANLPQPQLGVEGANRLIGAIGANENLIARVGLARGWDGPNHDWEPKRCYVQLNGLICPEDNWHRLGL